MNDMTVEWDNLANALGQLADAMEKFIVSFAKAFVKVFEKCFNHDYASPRAIHLARYGKTTARVRKKNLNRMRKAALRMQKEAFKNEGKP
jgi:hypothetical protein